MIAGNGKTHRTARRLFGAAAAAWLVSTAALATSTVDRAACLAGPTQPCVFALALEESEKLHLERMIPRMEIPEEKKAQWLDNLKDERGKAALEKIFRTHRGFAIVAAAQAEAGLLDDALKTVETVALVRKPMADWSLRDITETLARAGDFDGAARIFARIGNERARIQAGEAVVDEAMKAGSADKAVAFTNVVEPRKERARLLMRIARLQAATGDHPGARKTTGLAREAHEDVESNALSHIRRLIALGDIAAAKEAIANETDANVYMKSHWAKALAMHVAKEGRVEEAYAHLDGITQPIILKKALATIPGLLARHPKNTEEAVHRADRLEDPKSRASALIGVANAMANRGDVPGAYRVIGMLTEQGDVDLAYLAAGWILGHRGKLAEAERMIGKITDEDLGRRAYERLALNQAAAGDIAGVRRSLAKLPSDVRPVLLDEEFAVALARSGKARDGMESALDHWHFETRIRTLARIAVALGAK